MALLISEIRRRHDNFPSRFTPNASSHPTHPTHAQPKPLHTLCACVFTRGLWSMEGKGPRFGLAPRQSIFWPHPKTFSTAIIKQHSTHPPPTHTHRPTSKHSTFVNALLLLPPFLSLWATVPTHPILLPHQPRLAALLEPGAAAGKAQPTQPPTHPPMNLSMHPFPYPSIHRCMSTALSRPRPPHPPTYPSQTGGGDQDLHLPGPVERQLNPSS